MEFGIVLLEVRLGECGYEQLTNALAESLVATDGIDARRPVQKISEASTLGSLVRPASSSIVDEERTVAEGHARRFFVRSRLVAASDFSLTVEFVNRRHGNTGTTNGRRYEGHFFFVFFQKKTAPRGIMASRELVECF